MSVMETLTPAERAQQLAKPEGQVGRAVAEWMNEVNRSGYTGLIEQLRLTDGMQVLEVGPGNARHAADVIAVATDVHYSGLDLSATMVAEAIRINADLVTNGRAAFRLGSAERMPFESGAFDRVFSIGVMHFWRDPSEALAETRRVLREGGMMVMGGLSPRSANETFRSENGFFLRHTHEWEQICRVAGFTEVLAQEPAVTTANSDGVPITRYSILVSAKA